MSNKPEVTMSPLCQEITSNGHTVSVDIYDDGKGQWILEVIDTDNNSTVWEDPFKTDQEALDEVLDTIKQEGIECLVGQVFTLDQ